MPDERTKRKLSAILSADIVGFSRLMGVDETGTVTDLKKHRTLITELVQQYRGRVVDSPGDNILSEFTSVVDATECAVKIQQELEVINRGLPDDRKMEFRIGINLGDIIEDGGNLYGDGVNIAARIEGLADPGGICLSGSAFYQVENKLPLGFEYIGKQEVKNIAKPIRVYRVVMDPKFSGKLLYKRKFPIKRVALILALLAIVAVLAARLHSQRQSALREPAIPERMAFPLPDKPSIAVLPFTNLSEEPNQEYIADGLTENIITALSNISEIFVIARSSTFIYKNKPVKIQRVSEELGVRYVLEGSVQKFGDQLRITAQLIDATTGYHLWAEQYNRHLTDLFALQDEITFKIAKTLKIKLTDGEQGGIQHATDNFKAWEHLVRGTDQFSHFSKEGNQKARDHFEKAVTIDPKYTFAWNMLAWTYVIDAWIGLSPDPAKSAKKAIDLIKLSARQGNNPPEFHSLLSITHLLKRQYDESIIQGEKAITVGPNNALSHALFAFSLLFNGDFEDAVRKAERAVRLTPYCPDWYLAILGKAYRQAGRYQEAYAAFSKAYNRSHKDGRISPPALIGLIDVSVQLGRLSQAREYLAEFKKVYPNATPEWFYHFYLYKDPTHLERIMDNLRKAGL
jgi:adenylate cyclase